jgi:hypothetical protein
MIDAGEIGRVTHTRSRLLSDYAAHPAGALTWRFQGPVENDDHVSCLLRLTSGARVVLEAGRVAVGEQNNHGFEVHGTSGALFWDFRRLGELGVGRGDAHQDQPVCTVQVGAGGGAVCRVPAGRRRGDELRRPRGDRGPRLPAVVDAPGLRRRAWVDVPPL